MRLRLRWTRRKTILVATAAVLLVAGGLAAREWSLVNRLPMEVRHRMPWHCRIPSGLDPEVRAGIEGLYAADDHDRIEACYDLACLGPRSAPAVPYLVALLADAPLPDEPAPVWSSWRDTPIIGPIVRYFSWGSSKPARYGGASGTAREVLAEIGPAAVDPLLAALGDDSAGVRADAALALGNIADPRAIEPLASVLNDPRGGWPSAMAAVALSQFRDERAVQHLRGTLLQTGRPADPYLESIAVRALASMGSLGVPPLAEGAAKKTPGGTASLQWLATYLQNRMTLSPPANRLAAEALAAAVTDPDEERADAAVYGLKGIRDEPLVVDALIAATRHAYDSLRVKAIKGLAAAGGPRAADGCAEMLSDSDADVRKQAALGLARLGDRRCLPAICRDIATRDTTGSTDAAELLASLDDSDTTVDILNVLLADDEVEVFEEVAVRIEGRKDQRVLSLLVRAAEQWPGSTVIRRLLVSCGPDAAPALIACLGHCDKPYGILDILVALGDPRAVEPLIARLPQPGRGTNADIPYMFALADLHDSRALAPLLEIMRRDEWFQATAAEALGRLGDKRAIPALRALLANPRISVPQAPTGATSARGTILRSLLQLGDVGAIDIAFRQEPGVVHLYDNMDVFRRIGPAAIPPLTRWMTERNPDPDADPAADGWNHQAAVRGILFVGTPEALAEIRPVFARRDHDIFRDLAGMYHCLGVRPPTESLLALLAEHKDRRVRRDTAAILADDKDPRVVPALRAAAASDACTSVRIAAWDAIEKLTGEVRPASVPPRWLDDRTLADIPQPPAPTAAGGGLFTVPTQTTGGTP